jgi:hypothetical protein
MRFYIMYIRCLFIYLFIFLFCFNIITLTNVKDAGITSRIDCHTTTFLQWLVINIPESDIAKGYTMAPFVRSLPKKKVFGIMNIRICIHLYTSNKKLFSFKVNRYIIVTCILCTNKWIKSKAMKF